MSVLIKGMEMPKSGTYEVSIDTTNGKDKTVMSLFVRGDGGLICCGVYEIVPVSPHGRCIDENALLKGCGYIIADGMACIPVKYIANAPTIIPAEEGET